MAGQFFLCCWVKVFKARQYVLNGLYVVDAIKLVQGLVTSVQGDCRVNFANAGPHRASADSSSLLPFSDASAKHCSDTGNCLEVAAVQVRRHSDILTVGHPFKPYFLLSFGSCLHLANGDLCVSSLCISFIVTTLVVQIPVQEF